MPERPRLAGHILTEASVPVQVEEGAPRCAQGVLFLDGGTGHDHYDEGAAKVAEFLAQRREREAPDLGIEEFGEEPDEPISAVIARHPFVGQRQAQARQEAEEKAERAAEERRRRDDQADAERRERQRKKVTSAHVMLTFWFASEAEWRRFAAGDFAPAATGRTVEHKAWKPEPDWDAEDGYVRRFRYVHTCRNAGNWRSDAMKFVESTLRRSGQTAEEVQVHVELLRT